MFGSHYSSQMFALTVLFWVKNLIGWLNFDESSTILLPGYNKTSQSIWQLQQKLKAYQRKVSELQRRDSVSRGQGSRQPKEVLKDVSKGLQ
jgi:hypothetical protein